MSLKLRVNVLLSDIDGNSQWSKMLCGVDWATVDDDVVLRCLEPFGPSVAKLRGHTEQKQQATIDMEAEKKVI